MASRHIQESSEESAVSNVSSSFRADIELTNQLSMLLDQQQNEVLERQLDLPQDFSPEAVLERVLSPQSIISTVSSFAVWNQTQQSLAVGYRAIGFGQCGLVFERPGRNFVVKVAKRAYEETLWADMKAHFLVRQAFEKYDPECHAPRVFSFVPKDNQEWWSENIPFFAETYMSTPLPAMALITERILPLPRVARRALVSKYCPASLQAQVNANPTNRDCVARIYLGRRRPSNAPLSPNFTLRNFNLCLDQMIELALPVKLYAAGIGQALAIIHWASRVDGYDIEFVLGSEGDMSYSQNLSLSIDLTAEQLAAMPPFTDLEAKVRTNFSRRTTRMWVLDFNLCSVWDEQAELENPNALISHLVQAFFDNDPYYPLPLMEDELDQELWRVFSAAYFKMAGEIATAPGKDHRLASLARMFLDACVLRERENLDKGLGHGHRDR